MVHVATPLVRADRVELLAHARHAERGHVDDLGLAALEQRRAVGHREEVDLGRERSDVGDASSVDAHALINDSLSHDLLGDRSHGRLDLAQTVRELVLQVLDDRGRRDFEGRVARGLGRQLVRFGQRRRAHGLDALVDVILVVGDRLELHRRDLPARGDEVLHQFALEVDRFADPQLGGFESGREHFFRDLRRAVGVLLEGTLGTAGLDHHDRDVGVSGIAEGPSGDDQFESRGVALLVRRVRGPLAIGGVRHAHRTDRPLKGDARDHQRGRSGVDGQDVVGVLLVGAEDRADDLDLVAKALRERGAKRSVDETTGEDRLVRGLALTAEEGPGNLAGGVGALFDVDREREEVDAFSNALGRGDGRQQHGVAEASHDGSVGQLGQVARFKTQSLFGARYGATYADCVSHWYCSYLVSNTPPGSQWATFAKRDCSPLASEESDVLGALTASTYRSASDECRDGRSKRDSARHFRAARSRADGVVGR